MNYPLAPNAIFWSFQGEAHLSGFQQAFIRLAGCSVGCPGCDTDYSVERRETAERIVEEVEIVSPKGSRDRWVWITGGEPTDHDLGPLIDGLKDARFSVALATSGIRRFIPPVDWLSISPHDLNTQQLYGQEVKLVDGLKGLDIDAWVEKFPDSETDFMYRYAQPKSIFNAETGRWEEDPESLERCKKFALKMGPNWGLSRQNHYAWGVQ